MYAALITALSCKTSELSPHIISYKGKIVPGHSKEVLELGVLELWVHSFILNLGARLRQADRFAAIRFTPKKETHLEGLCVPKPWRGQKKNSLVNCRDSCEPLKKQQLFFEEYQVFGLKRIAESG